MTVETLPAARVPAQGAGETVRGAVFAERLRAALDDRAA
jgi:hypothetical protein